MRTETERARSGPSISLRAFLAALVLAAAPSASAQDAPARLSSEHPLILRPTPASRDLAERVRRTLALRMSVNVSVGDDAPPEVLEAVPEGHCAIALDAATVALVLAGPQGQVFRTELELEDRAPRAVARATALALEALHDVALDGPPQSVTQRRLRLAGGREVTWIYREREGGLFGPREPVEALAKPIVYLGFLGGVSTERLTPQVGPRVGFGLCPGSWCLLLDGDLPVVPEVSVACDGRQIEYRAVTLGLRALFLPFTFGDFSLGASLGLLTRFGIANSIGVDSSRLATNFGLRGSIEVSWAFAPPVELALDLGLDAHTSPAVLTRMNRPPPGVTCDVFERVLVEDIITVWAVLAVRLRP